jgi:hypothetical protein
MAETVYGFERGEFVEGFRRLGLARADAAAATEQLFDWSPGMATMLPAASALDPDVLAALSLVSLTCERRARAALDALPESARADALGRFRRARLSLGGRTE